MVGNWYLSVLCLTGLVPVPAAEHCTLWCGIVLMLCGQAWPDDWLAGPF